MKTMAFFIAMAIILILPCCKNKNKMTETNKPVDPWMQEKLTTQHIANFIPSFKKILSGKDNIPSYLKPFIGTITDSCIGCPVIPLPGEIISEAQAELSIIKEAKIQDPVSKYLKSVEGVLLTPNDIGKEFKYENISMKLVGWHKNKVLIEKDKEKPVNEIVIAIDNRNRGHFINYSFSEILRDLFIKFHESNLKEPTDEWITGEMSKLTNEQFLNSKKIRIYHFSFELSKLIFSTKLNYESLPKN